MFMTRHVKFLDGWFSVAIFMVDRHNEIWYYGCDEDRKSGIKDGNTSDMTSSEWMRNLEKKGFENIDFAFKSRGKFYYCDMR